MNPEEYVVMRELEDRHWWYRALRSAAPRHLRAHLGTRASTPRVLDAGCGTGGTLAALRESFPEAELTGLDLEEQAVTLTAARHVANAVVRASVDALPFAGDVFDAAMSLDVLYHAGVEEGAALSEMRRVLRPGGILIVNLPAFDALRGAHDMAVHGSRRYSPRRLLELAEANDLRVEHWTCWNMTLVPVLWAWRGLGRLAGSRASDVRPVAAWLNAALTGVLRLEWRLADRVALPFGSSLFAILRKPGAMTPDLSIVIPLYRSEEGIAALFDALASLSIPESFEIVFVNDGSPDRTSEICRELLAKAPFSATLVDLTRNFGEHNAVLAGYRQARGSWIVNIDDDLQNPPEEAVRLLRYARQGGFDVVYSFYKEKQHSAWRNLGSRLANALADLVLDKPKGLYLSSFRCVSAAVAREVARYDGPFVYIDGLITQVTQRIGALEVRHDDRRFGESTYRVRTLARLWLNILFNFSVLPLRLAIALGLVTAVAGLSLLVQVIAERLTLGTPVGWGSLMAALTVFAGVQLIVLGGVGEYVGRVFLTLNRRPQSVVREVVVHERSLDEESR